MMNEHDSHMVSITIQASVTAVEYELRLTAECHREPSVLYRPIVFVDGDQWCALYGENLQDGVAGFGKSPADAMAAFNAAWCEQISGAPEIFPGTNAALAGL